MARQFGSGTDWLAPFALAARMRAETGDIQGRGFAALGQGIGAGITAFGAERTRKEERADTIARDEARFNLTREDRLQQQDYENQIQAKQLEESTASGKLLAAGQLYQVASAEHQKAQQDYEFDRSDEHLVALKQALQKKNDAYNALTATAATKMQVNGVVNPPSSHATGLGKPKCLT